MAGSAYRRTDFVRGETQNNVAALATLHFDWRLAENITFQQDVNAVLQSGNSTFQSFSAFRAGITDDVSVRLSYEIEHDTNPPPGAVSTDTLSRFTFVFGF